MLRYFISREFFLTLLGLAGLGVVLYLAIFFWVLPAYTRHGEGLTVPDVYNMDIEEAIEQLEEAGFRPAIADSIDPPDEFQGMKSYHVLKQYPEPYARVKPDRLISLTVQKLKMRMVSLPEIFETEGGKTSESYNLNEAKNRLLIAGLRLGNVIEVPYQAAVVLGARYNGKALNPGDKIPARSAIDLEVGSGKKSIRVEIPDLEGHPYEYALNMLRERGLGVGIIKYNPNGPQEEEGRVYDQNPRPNFGDSIAYGASIDLFIYGPEPTTTEGILIEEVEEEPEIP